MGDRLRRAARRRRRKAMGELGDAELLGHHVIVRAGRQAETTRSPDASRSPRPSAPRCSRRTSATSRPSILLHMLAQTLGAIAESDPAWIQNPSVLAEAIDVLGSQPRPVAARDRSAAHRRAPTRRSRTTCSRRSRSRTGAAGSPPITTRSSPRCARSSPPARPARPRRCPGRPAIEQYDRIKALARSEKKYAERAAELENVLIAYPGERERSTQLKCEILIAKQGVADKATRPRARASASWRPAIRRRTSRVADGARYNAGDIAGARAELVLAARQDREPRHRPAGRVAAARRDLHADGRADVDGGGARGRQARQGDPRVAQIASTRARYGVPKGGKLVKPEAEARARRGDPEGEPADLRATSTPMRTRRSTRSTRSGRARPALAFRCDLAMREGALESAKAYCAKALRHRSERVVGALSLGRDRDPGHQRRRHEGPGSRSSRRAIAVDPDLGQAWRTLAKAYARAKDQAALEKLAQDYATKFGTPLPQ